MQILLKLAWSAQFQRKHWNFIQDGTILKKIVPSGDFKPKYPFHSFSTLQPIRTGNIEIASAQQGEEHANIKKLKISF